VVVVVSVLPVVPVVPVVFDVSVAGFGFAVLVGVLPLLVGGLPGRGGSRLVAVATLPPPFGATAVEVTAVVVFVTVGVEPLLAAIVPAVAGIGGTGVTLTVVSVATAVEVVTAVSVAVDCVCCVVDSVDSERVQAAKRARTRSAAYLTRCILSQDARHAFAALADRGCAARAQRPRA
jgi:hypothetical protein